MTARDGGELPYFFTWSKQRGVRGLRMTGSSIQ